MVENAKIKLSGETLGYLYWDSVHAVSQFEYDDAFVASGKEVSPLMMPLRKGAVYSFPSLSSETFMGLPGLVADSLPDTYGRALLDRWLALEGRTEANPVEQLCFMGSRCMGALEYEPATFVRGDSTTSLEIDSLVRVAGMALLPKEEFCTNISEDTKDAITQILRLGTSAGGQRAKAIIAYNPQTGQVRSGQVDAPEGFEHYLIKLDGVDGNAGLKETKNFGRLEYSFYKAAENCGINMMESRLIEENGRAHFMTKRFDRCHGRKVHVQTLCGMAHYDFRLMRAYSYEQAFAVMRRLRLSYGQVAQMYRRLVFNVVARNNDDHTKNISFLMDEMGQWSLSEAYDIGFAYNPEGKWTSSHQMSVRGKFDGIGREDLLDFAEDVGVKNAESLIDEVVDGLGQWPGMAASAGVPAKMVEAIYPLFNFL